MLDLTGYLELRRIFETHRVQLGDYINKISDRNFQFTNSLAIASSTIASFSLLILQTNVFLKINVSYLLFGFTVLVFNTFLSLLIAKTINQLETSAMKVAVKLVEMEGDLLLIIKDDPNYNSADARRKLDEMRIFWESRDKNVTEFKKFSPIATIGVYTNIIAFFVGILFIVFSVVN